MRTKKISVSTILCIQFQVNLLRVRFSIAVLSGGMGDSSPLNKISRTQAPLGMKKISLEALSSKLRSTIDKFKFRQALASNKNTEDQARIIKQNKKYFVIFFLSWTALPTLSNDEKEKTYRQ